MNLIKKLNFTAALRSATIVGHGSHIDDLGDDDPGVINGPDSGLTAGSRALDIDFDLAETSVVSGLGSVLSSHLGGIGSVLLGPAETALSS